MNDQRNQLASLDVDEAWIVEWATAGLRKIEHHLANHAAFGDFLRARDDLDWCDGDGRADA